MALSDLLLLSAPGKIGDIEIAATLEESHHDTLEVTEHPVEMGAAITDHSYKRPAEVTLVCAWSNSSVKALSGAVAALFDGGSIDKGGYVGGVYAQLLALQESRVPFKITTTKREYQDMLITNLSVTTDQKTSNVLMVTATCRQILRVYTAVTTVGSVENTGVAQAVPQSPAPGGSMPPFDSGTGEGWDSNGKNLPEFDAGSGMGW